MVRAAVLGASGYTGGELLRLLLGHPEVELTAISSRSYAGMALEECFGSFAGASELIFETGDAADFAERCDVLFMALPHGVAAGELRESILERCVVIDLGADFRLSDPEIYCRWYGIPHPRPELIPQAVYGLSELAAEQVRASNLIANPGCYTTCSILTLAPLLASERAATAPLIVDAKSGVSGAGRTLREALHFGEADETVKAYSIGTHRHTPELEESLSRLNGERVTVQFTPHLVPMNRGILSTCYALPRESGYRSAELLDDYRNFYAGQPFVRILPEGRLPETRWVKGSNYIDISVQLDERSGMMVAVGALDNLIKGAAGQAVQNMNLRFGFDPTTGLGHTPLFPA
jgi:N-acetyl-gamma-glutamyl-phosphate reductase